MAKDKINSQASNLQGTVVSIWFYNNGRTGPLGYDQSKKIVYQKISRIHDDVKSGKITLQQAINQIISDPDLEKIDRAYKSNAALSFNVQQGEQITFVPEFDSRLWQLQEDEITDVYLAKDNTKSQKEAVYMFGQVSKKNLFEKIANFSDWLIQAQKKYEITYY
jgi:hypothetical protein